jgi:hypothetical protein
MTDSDLTKLIRQNIARETVSTEDGINAGSKLAEAAAGVSWAFAGGIAMHIYGYVRATTDVDIIAERDLDLLGEKDLSFGGSSYNVDLQGRTVVVDWIVRSDENAKFYREALKDTIITDDGIRVISPEWLVVLKHLAGRPKDKLDQIWLLQESGLVDRETVKSNIKRVLGEYASFLINDIQSDFDYADVLSLRGERNKYE